MTFRSRYLEDVETRLNRPNEPYVFSSQVKQIFYSKDPTDEGWYVVLRNIPRDLFDMGNGSRDGIDDRSETLPFPEQNLNENIPSTSRNNFGQHVGSEARLLAGYLGIIARNANMLPINYESWHQMPDSNKNQALDNIKVSDNYVKKALGKRWRNHKSTLKKEYFKTKTTLEEKLRNVPLGMLRTSSRQKQKFTHTTGSKSFPCLAEDEDKLKDKKAEYQAVASSDSSINLDDIDNWIITKVLGPERYGRVRFQGSFVNPTQYFRSSSQQYMPSGSQAQAEVQRLRDQMTQMQASTDE
ncbi:hypothetical protein Gotur_024945 [Gossypium turneri]